MIPYEDLYGDDARERVTPHVPVPPRRRAATASGVALDSVPAAIAAIAAGAAVVVSTIATVLGAHAVQVGTRIVADLLEQVAATGGQPHLGELLRQAKCRALLASQPMALCVVAFGDADWRL